MKMTTIKEAIIESWNSDEIKEVARHGCGGGSAPGLVYYTGTVEFHDEHEDEIWDMLHEDASDADKSVMQLIAEFNGQRNVGSMTQLKNLLCWYAVERVCREMVEGVGR